MKRFIVCMLLFFSAYSVFGLEERLRPIEKERHDIFRSNKATMKLYPLGILSKSLGCESNDFFVIKNDKVIILRRLSEDSKVLALQEYPLNKVSFLNMPEFEGYADMGWFLGDKIRELELEKFVDAVCYITIYVSEPKWHIVEPEVKGPILEKPDK